jgi:hypothetical protein
MVIECKGKLIFQPENKTKKHEKQDWKKVAMIMLNCDLDKYYAWFLTQRFNLEFVKTLRGSHVTIISDKVSQQKFDKIARKYNGKEITFYYETEPKTNVKHWWLRVHSPEAEIIREEMGLHKEPYFGFHLTIGYMNHLNLQYSDYIFRIIKRFNILSSEPRTALQNHEIIKYNDVKIDYSVASDEFEFNSKKVFFKEGHYTDIKHKVTK